ncbi:MAG TPA: phosphatase PAP2 family protein [Hyphomicrobiales bacterium]|nr:phosphatase PAP2 family protein [Hyphomicrobiales bacterium]
MIERVGGPARTASVYVYFYGAVIALIVLAYFFVDRPLAELSHSYLRGDRLFIWLTYIVDPLGPSASVIAAAAAVRGVLRGSITPTESALLRASCAILIAGVLTYELKAAFGRTWPETWINDNPSYFGNGTYGFFPFHGGRGYASFPSGHTTAIAAFAGSVWFLWPKLKWVGIVLTLAVAIGLLGADYHWLSDIIAGAAVGGTTGAISACIAARRDSP